MERHLKTSGADENPRVVIATLPPQPSSSTDVTRAPSIYFLQRWIPKWRSFVNVESVNNIKREDRLTVAEALSNSEV